jgi:cytochrome P450
VDLVRRFAYPLPSTVISELLGIPPTPDHERLRALIGTMVRSLEPVSDPGMQAKIRSASGQLMTMVDALIGWKRANPGTTCSTALSPWGMPAAMPSPPRSSAPRSPSFTGPVTRPR